MRREGALRQRAVCREKYMYQTGENGDKKGTIRPLIAALAASLLLAGCGGFSDAGTGILKEQDDREAGEAASVVSVPFENDGFLHEDAAEGEKQNAGNTKTAEKGEEEMELKDFYMELLGAYLKEQLGLEEYDLEIREMGCLPKEGKTRSEAQIRGNMGLTYLYLRNDVHTERLEEKDRTVLAAGIGQSEGDAYDHAMEVVVRTFPLCITPFVPEQEEDKKFTYIYDNVVLAQNGETAVTMDTLLLRVATRAEYDEEGEYVDAYREVQKEKGLYELADRMEEEMEGLLGDIPIVVQIDFIS